MTSIDASVPQPQAPLVRVLAADGTFAPTAAAEPYLALIDALPDAELPCLVLCGANSGWQLTS